MWIKKEYCFSLKEIIDNVTGQSNLPYSNLTLKEICEEASISLIALPFNIESPFVTRLWDEFFAKNFNKIAIIKNNEDIQEDIQNWLFKLLSILSRTFDYYNALLSSYDALKDKLTADLQTTSDNYVTFNDTPQNIVDYDDEDYITNFTKSKNVSTTPTATPIQRLKELQENYMSLYNKWCKELRGLIYAE